MSQLEPQAGHATGSSSKSAVVPARRHGFGRVIVGIFVVLSFFWLTMFSISLWSLPSDLGSSNTPELDVMAIHLPDGKNRLGLTTPDGKLHRHHCDPLSRLCRFVVAHSPVDLKVRMAGPSSGLSDSAIVSARDGDSVLVSGLEGLENIASLKRTYLGGLMASVAGLLLGSWLLRSTDSARN